MKGMANLKLEFAKVKAKSAKKFRSNSTNNIENIKNVFMTKNKGKPIIASSR